MEMGSPSLCLFGSSWLRGQMAHLFSRFDPNCSFSELIKTLKISNVIWTKCRLKCNLETRIFQHVYHIKITLQDHTRLQKERIMGTNHSKPHKTMRNQAKSHQTTQNYAKPCETTQKHAKPRKTTQKHTKPRKTMQNHTQPRAPCETVCNHRRPHTTMPNRLTTPS